MEIVSIASTPVPAYFIIAPIVIVLVVLLVLIIKPSPKQESALVAPVIPEATPITIQQPVQELTKADTAQELQQVMPVAQPVEITGSPAVETSTFVTPAPSLPSSPQGVIPPVSSWKPKDPISTIIVEDVSGIANTQPIIESPVSFVSEQEAAPQVISPEKILASIEHPQNQPPTVGQTSTQAVPTF